MGRFSRRIPMFSAKQEPILITRLWLVILSVDAGMGNEVCRSMFIG